METKTVVTNSQNERIVIDKYLIFKWKCEEKKYVGNKIHIRFSRDENMKNIEEIKKLENEYGEFKIPSMLPTFIFPGISMTLITVFLILYLNNKENVWVYFFSLMLPALLFIFASFIFMLLRTKAIARIDIEKPKRDQEYKAKIEKLL